MFLRSAAPRSKLQMGAQRQRELDADRTVARNRYIQKFTISLVGYVAKNKSQNGRWAIWIEGRCGEDRRGDRRLVAKLWGIAPDISK